MLSRRAVLTGAVGVVASRFAGEAMAAVETVPTYADKFDTAFEPGFSWSVQLSSDGPKLLAPFKTIDGGLLTLPSGRIVACDPFVGPERPAFLITVPRGSYPLRFAYPMVHGEAGGRVAFARLDISKQPVVRWQMALIAGQDVTKLKGDEFFGYPVDAGTGCFADADTMATLLQLMTADAELSQGWISEGEVAGKAKGMNWYLDKLYGSGNILMFESGWGDGAYASYFGYDAQGKVAALLTDFQVIDWSKGG